MPITIRSLFCAAAGVQNLPVRLAGQHLCLDAAERGNGLRNRALQPTKALLLVSFAAVGDVGHDREHAAAVADGHAVLTLRHFIEIAYGILLRGVGLDVLWPSVLSMTLLGLLWLGAALWRLRRQFA